MMKAPPPSLESYMQAMLKPQGAAGPSLAPSAMAINTAQTEVNKLRQLQAKKIELQQQLQSIDAQMMKVQGALDVLQTLGLISKM